MPNSVWTTWTTTTTTASTYETWNAWIGETNTAVTAYTASTASNNIIWRSWVDAGAADTWDQWTTVEYVTGDNYNAKPYVDNRTAEQKAADDARIAAERADIARKAKEAEDARKAAILRARELLHSMLDVKQREQLQTSRFFEVISKNSRRTYRIHQGTHGNVKLLDDKGNEITSYCAQPDFVPTEDSMLAQKLMIEHEEEAFLKVANATPLRRRA